MKNWTFLFLLILGVMSCVHDKVEPVINSELQNLIKRASLDGTTDYFLLPNHLDYKNIPQDPKNPITQDKVELGNFLFFETGLAVDAHKSESIGTYSCATCHNPLAGFKPNNFQGIADGGLGLGYDGDGRRMNTNYTEDEIDVQSARPLSLINVAYVENTMWNGMFGSTGVNEGTEDLWSHNLGNHTNYEGFEGIMSSNLEGQIVHRLNISKEFCDENGYTELFDKAYPDIPEEERYTQETVVRSLSAFIRTITASEAPFQDYLRGNLDALTSSEKNGARLFFSDAKCTNCHNSPGLSSVTFHVMGVKDMYQLDYYNAKPDDFRNLGRGGFTGLEEEMYAFKTPTVYNLDDTPFYFHGSSMTSIEEVVRYKNEAISENSNIPDSLLSHSFNPLYLSDEEQSDLVAFLRNGLRDPNLERYIPAELPSGNCFPNADEISRRDLGCQ